MSGTLVPETALEHVRQFYRHAAVRESWPWRHWNAHPLVARTINRRISGSPDRTLPQALGDLLPGLGLALPVARCASLGCGRGRLDRCLHRHGIVTALEGFDLSPDSVEAADFWARQAGIREFSYQPADLNRIELEPGRYDLVVCEMSLHHVLELERLYEEIARALRPGGLLVIDEYAGPTRFRWTTRQMETVNGILTLFSTEQRTTPDGILKPLVEHLPDSFFETNDPSEAIRSGEVVSCLEQRFDVRWKRPYGGTVLHPLLHDIACNFADGDPLSETLLNTAISIEEALMAAGELESDFVVIAASPK